MEYKCCLCSFETNDKKSLSTHIQLAHKMTSEQYTINHLYGGVRPVCKACGGEVRYVSFEFKKYCKNCSKIACSEAGKTGGRGNKKPEKQNFITTEKFCNKCETSQPLDNFYSGTNICKTCALDVQKDYRKKNFDTIFIF